MEGCVVVKITSESLLVRAGILGFVSGVNWDAYDYGDYIVTSLNYTSVIEEAYHFTMDLESSVSDVIEFIRDIEKDSVMLVFLEGDRVIEAEVISR